MYEVFARNNSKVPCYISRPISKDQPYSCWEDIDLISCPLVYGVNHSQLNLYQVPKSISTWVVYFESADACSSDTFSDLTFFTTFFCIPYYLLQAILLNHR